MSKEKLPEFNVNSFHTVIALGSKNRMLGMNEVHSTCSGTQSDLIKLLVMAMYERPDLERIIRMSIVAKANGMIEVERLDKDN